MQIQPYLFFDGRCEEALQFYREKLGAEVTGLLRFSESPDLSAIPAGSENKVMHSNLKIGDSVVMASDGNCGGNPTFSGFTLTLLVASDEEAQRAFAALGEGGTVRMPLAKTFFASSFGMLTDRFGVGWMIYVAPAG